MSRSACHGRVCLRARAVRFSTGRELTATVACSRLRAERWRIGTKKELRDKVDVNLDVKVSFLEYLLYQYREVANSASRVTSRRRRRARRDQPQAVRRGPTRRQPFHKSTTTDV